MLQPMTGLRLKWKFSLLFGLLIVLAVGVATYVQYLFTFQEFSKELGERLHAIGAVVAQVVDPGRLGAITSVQDPYYKEMKVFLRTVMQRFNLPWLAFYKYNGRIFTHLVDGDDFAGEFIPDYPIMDIPSELRQSWNDGVVASTAANVDAFGSWCSLFYPIKGADGKVVAVLDVSKDNENLARFQKEITARAINTTLLLIAVSLLVSWGFSAWLINPIVRLTEGVKQIAGGDLSIRITGIHSRDEIGTLVTTFNTMTEELARSKHSLEKKIFELSTLFDISQKINFANSTQEILKLILQKSVEALHAKRGSLLLFNEESGDLSVEVVYGEGITIPEKRIHLLPGEGVAGKVFTDLKPFILNERVEEHFKPYATDVRVDLTNIMCLPLLLEKRGIGVLNIVNKIGGDFDGADLSLATTMASQIALSLEKSRLYELSVTDGLTKLFVHRYFQAALSSEMKRAKRYQNKLSLILFDIDHFKKFNDTWGHQMGDRVLTLVATILKDSLRTPDIAARYGGEEFTIILPETDLQSAYTVAERLRKAIEAYDISGPDGQVIKVTISLGICEFPLHAAEKLDLIKKADDALYASKKNGRNCSTMYQPAET